MYRLLIISNCGMILGEIIDVIFKKQACIDKFHAMCNDKSYTYIKKEP